VIDDVSKFTGFGKGEEVLATLGGGGTKKIATQIEGCWGVRAVRALAGFGSNEG
jgi:hypothetical protein